VEKYNLSNINAYYSQRYGWHLKEYMKPEDCKICKTCGHSCHCSNGGSCCGGECNCKNCEHHISYEANNA